MLNSKNIFYRYLDLFEIMKIKSNMISQCFIVRGFKPCRS